MYVGGKSISREALQAGGETKEQPPEPKTEASDRMWYIFQQMPAWTDEQGQVTTHPHSDAVAQWEVPRSQRKRAAGTLN